jgi:hypothetical protein
LRWIGTELCDPPKYDGLTNISYFVKVLDLHIPEQQILFAIDVVLKDTPSRWWDSHKERIEYWLQCKILMQVRFGNEVEYTAQKYTRVSNPIDHIAQCRKIWSSILKKEWTHEFTHTLDMIPKNWYLELEIHRETMDWDKTNQIFKVTFTFEDEYSLIDASLQAIRNKIF